MKLEHLALAAALTVSTGLGLAATPASAKSQSIAGMACTNGAVSSSSFADLGSGRFNVGITTSQYGRWKVEIFVDGATTPRTSYTTAGEQFGLNYIAVMNPGKGKHRFQIVATNLTLAGVCTANVGSGI